MKRQQDQISLVTNEKPALINLMSEAFFDMNNSNAIFEIAYIPKTRRIRSGTFFLLGLVGPLGFEPRVACVLDA